MKVGELSQLLALSDLKEHLFRVEAILDQSIGVENDWLSEPARRVVQGGGKRLRPTIALASAVVGGSGISENVMKGAAALELVHVGSLVHDDIMDSATSRRGVATVNAKEGINHAVLIGDFLLARAGQLASTISAEVAHALATAIVELCDGQSLETGYLYRADRTRSMYEKAIAGKTAALMRGSCRIGALAAGLPAPVIASLSEFGTAFGMAFQIIDDVLDLISTPQAMGKPVGNDIREGVYTLPLLMLLEEESGSWVRDQLRRGIGDDTIDTIVAHLDSSGLIDGALDVARKFNADAAAALDGITDSPTLAGLRSLPSEYFDWVLSEKAPHRQAGTRVSGR